MKKPKPTVQMIIDSLEAKRAEQEAAQKTAWSDRAQSYHYGMALAYGEAIAEVKKLL